MLRKIQIFIEQKDFVMSKRACDEAIAAGVDSSGKVYAYRGASHLGLNQYALAERDCEVAHKLDPTLTMAIFWLALAKRGTGDWKGVVLYASKVLKSHPCHVTSWSLRCEAKRQLGMWRSVVADTSTVLKFDRKNGAVWCARAEALMHLGKLSDAETSATNGIKYASDLPMLYQIRGESRYQQKKFKLSIDDFHNFTKLDRVRRNAPFTAHAYAIWKRNRDRPW